MKKALTLMSVIAVVFFSTSVFANTNVQNYCNDWANDSVTIAHAIGFVDSNKSYQYKNSISREDFCELLYNLIMTTDYFENFCSEQSKEAEKLSPVFNDTNNNIIHILYNHNIVCGKTESEFAPSDSITREEAATIIFRMINIVQPLMSAKIEYSLDDMDEVSDWALKAVYEITSLGLMNGVGDNMFAPKKIYTTEQAIVTLLRVYNAFKDKCVLKFVDKDGNIILTEDDIISCETKYGHLSPYAHGEWYVEITLTDDAREKIKNATNHILRYSDNYLTIIVDNSIISNPRVMEEIDSETLLITGNLTLDAARVLEDTINLAKKMNRMEPGE